MGRFMMIQVTVSWQPGSVIEPSYVMKPEKKTKHNLDHEIDCKTAILTMSLAYENYECVLAQSWWLQMHFALVLNPFGAMKMLMGRNGKDIAARNKIQKWKRFWERAVSMISIISDILQSNLLSLYLNHETNFETISNLPESGRNPSIDMSCKRISWPEMWNGAPSSFRNFQAIGIPHTKSIVSRKNFRD